MNRALVLLAAVGVPAAAPIPAAAPSVELCVPLDPPAPPPPLTFKHRQEGGAVRRLQGVIA